MPDLTVLSIALLTYVTLSLLQFGIRKWKR